MDDLNLAQLGASAKNRVPADSDTVGSHSDDLNLAQLDQQCGDVLFFQKTQYARGFTSCGIFKACLKRLFNAAINTSVEIGEVEAASTWAALLARLKQPQRGAWPPQLTRKRFFLARSCPRPHADAIQDRPTPNLQTQIRRPGPMLARSLADQQCGDVLLFLKAQ